MRHIPKTAITEKALRILIKQEIKASSLAMSEWAKLNGISPQVISAFFRKIQGPGLKLPEFMGYRPQTVYIPLDEELIQELPAPRRPTDKPSKKVDHTKSCIEKAHLKGVDPKQVAKEKLRMRAN